MKKCRDGGAVEQSDVELGAAQQSAEALGLAQLEGRARSRPLNLLVNTGRVHEVLEQSDRVAMNEAIARNHAHDAHAHRRASLDALGLLSAPKHHGAPLFGYDVLITARALLREDPAPEVRAIIESALTMKRVFVEQRDGAWFGLSGDDKRTDCTDAPVLQRMLAAFCARVASAPGAIIARGELSIHSATWFEMMCRYSSRRRMSPSTR